VTNANNDTVSDLALILQHFFRSEDLGLRKGVGHAAQGLNPLIKRRVEERAGAIGGWQFLKYTLLIHWVEYFCMDLVSSRWKISVFTPCSAAWLLPDHSTTTCTPFGFEVAHHVFPNPFWWGRRRLSERTYWFAAEFTLWDQQSNCHCKGEHRACIGHIGGFEEPYQRGRSIISLKHTRISGIPMFTGYSRCLSWYLLMSFTYTSSDFPRKEAACLLCPRFHR
jgi:hypothetical protein